MDLVWDHLGCFWEENLFWICLSLWFKKWDSFKGQFGSRFQILRRKVINYLLGFLFQRIRGYQKKKRKWQTCQGFPSMDFSFISSYHNRRFTTSKRSTKEPLRCHCLWSDRNVRLVYCFFWVNISLPLCNSPVSFNVGL